MKRSQIDTAIARCLTNAAAMSVALPRWADWSPDKFDATAAGIKAQKLGWKVVDFGLDDFANCGLVVFVLANAIADEKGEPLLEASTQGGKEYCGSSFSRKLLFVQAGQTEPHHFHRQKERKEVSILAGAPVTFELAWGESDTALSERDVDVQVDGIWHHLPAGGKVTLQPGETITLPGNLSHIISVAAGGKDVIMLETSTANNDSKDNIFPFITPSSKVVEEDAAPRYQLLDEHKG